jgi:hypothetical protein
MTDPRFDLDELLGDASPDERERLRRVHEILVEAGPPPELSPELEIAPAPPSAQIQLFPRRYRYSSLVAAAVAAVTLFGAGYFIGGNGGPSDAERTVAMTGPNGASAMLDVFAADAAGNWPMELSVTRLAVLPKGQHYALWLTVDGELADQCGTFAVTGGTTVVPLNAPYPLKKYTGWVVVQEGSSDFVLRTPTV